MDEQIRQMYEALELHECQPFSRCLECNRRLESVDKELVFERVPRMSI